MAKTRADTRVRPYMFKLQSIGFRAVPFVCPITAGLPGKPQQALQLMSFPPTVQGYYLLRPGGTDEVDIGILKLA